MNETRTLSSTLQHVGRTLRAEDLADLGDAELVARFARDRDEAAFAALVRRYGGLVQGVCLRVLRHHEDAEDAFQAVFLVLARNAGRVERAGAIGNWLYGVAFNVSRKAKRMRQKREARERAAIPRAPDHRRVHPVEDLREILDAELAALDDKYRTAVILCDVMGLTTERAAAETGCPAKTMGTRLARGRVLLAARLARRGVVVPAAVLCAALATAATATVPPRLLSSTIATATAPAASPAIANLAQGVSMSLKSLKVVAVAACGIFLCSGLASHLIQAAPPGASPSDTFRMRGNSTRASRPTTRHDPFHHFVTHVLLQLGIGHAGGDPIADMDQKEDDKPALAGVWVKKEGELKLDFSEKDILLISPHGENKVVVIRCETKGDKDGVVRAKIADIEGKDEAVRMIKEKLPIGTEFSFKWTVTKESATLEDLKGEKIEIFKMHLEGEFGKK